MEELDEIVSRIKVDIIYVNFNSTDYLLTSIESLLMSHAKHFDLNVIVVDNASTDDADRIARRFPDVKLTLNAQNIGFGAAINYALTTCDAPYTVIINPDSLTRNGFLPTVIDYMQTYTDVGIVGPMILDESGGIQGSARSFPNPLTSLFGRNSPITKMYPNNSITRANILTLTSDLATPMPVDWVSGACMVVRREAIDQVNGFDEQFFLYWEDTDLCQRVKDAGWKIVYLPACKIIHIGGRSSNTRPIFANFHFHRSCYRLYAKYARWPYSLFTSFAAIALMLRFLLAALINHLRMLFDRCRRPRRVPMAEQPNSPGMIRILRCISRMNIGGPSIHVKNLSEFLDPQRYVTRLLTGTISAHEGDMSYIADFRKTVRVNLPQLQREISPVKDITAILKVVREINRFKPQILHSHTSKAGAVARTAATLYGLLNGWRPITVHTFHGHVLDGYFSPLKSASILCFERLLAKVTDSIVSISSTQKKELAQKYRIAPLSKIATIGLGFNLNPFVNNRMYKGHLRKRLNVSADTLLIGIVGRIVPIKNHHMFLDAARDFIQAWSERKVMFILIGRGELESTLASYAEKIGIAEYVVFYGWEKNIPMIYADLDILALTSLNEGTPVSIIEAMAAKVPIVTTNVGGIKDLLGPVRPGQPKNQRFSVCERGILCPTNRSDVFADALGYLADLERLSTSYDLEMARDYVLKHYSMERLLSDIERLYDALLARCNNG